MAIKKVVYFETTNGLCFQNEADAIEAEKTYQIKDLLFKFLDAGDFSEKDCQRISVFIAENRKGIIEILTFQ